MKPAIEPDTSEQNVVPTSCILFPLCISVYALIINVGRTLASVFYGFVSLLSGLVVCPASAARMSGSITRMLAADRQVSALVSVPV